MMSTPRPRPIRVCVSIATLLGHCPAAPSNLLLMFAPILFVISVSIVSTRALSLLLALVLSILLFSGPRNVACSMSVSGLLAKFVNE